MRTRRRMIRWIMLVLSSLVLLGCGSNVERHIENLGGSRDEREQAMMELALMKTYAIPPLIHALNDPKRPVDVRADIAEIPFRMYVRESDVRIMPALLEHVDSEEAEIRVAIVSALTNIGKVDALHPLLDRLEKERSPEVQQKILSAIQTLDRWEQQRDSGGGFRVLGGENMTEEEKVRFIERLQVLQEQTSEPELRDAVVEFLEEIAQQIVEEGDKAVLEADLSGAEAKYQEAKALVPGSANVNHRLGKFYFDNVSEEKGLEVLREQGLVIHRVSTRLV